MIKRLVAAGVAASVLVAGCSGDPTPPLADEGAVRGEADGGARDGSDEQPRVGQRKDRGEETDPRKSRSGSNPDAAGSPGSGDAPDDDPRSGTTEQIKSAYPAAGTFAYRQEGFEEFCQTTSCDRRKLPARETVTTSYRSRTAASAVLVSEARSSDKRLTRTTFRFSEEKALITDVYTRFDYQGVRFEESYHPAPPVEALRFPLASGKAWSGRWEDETSGKYSVSVGPRESVEAAGRNVKAFRVETNVTFEGQFRGSSTTLVWFDPDTKTIVRSEGEMEVRSAYGSYRTEFSTILGSGPGY